MKKWRLLMTLVGSLLTGCTTGLTYTEIIMGLSYPPEMLHEAIISHGLLKKGEEVWLYTEEPTLVALRISEISDTTITGFIIKTRQWDYAEITPLYFNNERAGERIRIQIKQVIGIEPESGWFIGDDAGIEWKKEKLST